MRLQRMKGTRRFQKVQQTTIPNSDNAVRSDGVEGTFRGWKGVREGKVVREDNSLGRFIIDRAADAPPVISSHDFSFVLRGEQLFLGAN